MNLSSILRFSTRGLTVFGGNTYVPATLDVQNLMDDSSSGSLVFNDTSLAIQTLIRTESLIGKRVQIARTYQSDPVAIQTSTGETWTVAGFASIVSDAAGAYLRLEGTDGSFASTPNSAALALVKGTFRLEAKVAFDSYNSAANQTIIGKWGAGQFLFTLQNSSMILHVFGVTSGYGYASAYTTGLFVSGGTYIFRVDRVLSTGAVTFSYSADDGATFVQIDAVQTLYPGQLLTATTDALQISANTNGWVPKGKIYWAKVYSDLGTTLAAEIKFTPQSVPFWYFDGYIQSAMEGAEPQITINVSRDAARRSLSPNKRIGPSTGFNVMAPEGQIIRFRQSAFRLERSAK